MNVVIRGLMAAAMAVYATLHLLQALSPPEGSPGWLVAAFAGSAVVALVLAGGLIFGAQRREAGWEHGAALLAALSLVALITAFSVGFFGVEQSDLRPATALVFVAELVVLVSWVAARFATRATSEVSEAVPTRPPSDAKTGADPSD